MKIATRIGASMAAAAALAGAGVAAHAAVTTADGVASYTPPAPTTAAGYQKMFDRLDPAQWGGADGAISVPVTAQRTVWLFGDTFSKTHGMVHSTAVTQDGGSLHVSNYGTQLLPDGGYDDRGRKIIYWIEDGWKTGSNTIKVSAQPVSIGDDTGTGWDFHRANPKNRVAALNVLPSGDVQFDHWAGHREPVKHDTRLYPLPGQPQTPGHFAYGKRSHPEAHLADGKTLVTWCQNWDKPQTNPDGTIHYQSYRPIFEEN